MFPGGFLLSSNLLNSPLGAMLCVRCVFSCDSAVLLCRRLRCYCEISSPSDKISLSGNMACEVTLFKINHGLKNL